MLHAGLTEDLVKISLFGQNEMDAFVEEDGLIPVMLAAERLGSAPDIRFLPQDPAQGTDLTRPPSRRSWMR